MVTFFFIVASLFRALSLTGGVKKENAKKAAGMLFVFGWRGAGLLLFYWLLEIHNHGTSYPGDGGAEE